MGGRSITRQLIITLVIGITFFWCLAGIGSNYVFTEELNETFDLALKETAERLLPLAIDDLGDRDDDGPARQLVPSLLGRVEYLNYQISDQSGRVLLHTADSAELPPDVYAGAPRRGFRTVEDYRTYSETDDTTGLTLTLAEITSHRSEAIGDSTRTLFWPLLPLLPLSVIGIWLIVRQTLMPVHRLSAQIAARDGGNLEPLDVSDQPRELRPIAEATARLLERLRAALDAERAFAANSAHELRTPLAGALAQTQRLIAEIGTAPGAARAREIEQALRRLSDLSEKLLQISRMDTGLGATDTAIDLLPALDLVVHDFRSVVRSPELINYQRPSPGRLTAPMDLDAFAIVMRNLLENAIKHGKPDTPIDIAIDGTGALVVGNESELIASEQLQQLSRRFARGATEAAGSGLGLAIVETIMRQSGGELTLRSPRAGRADGFEAVLILPR